MNGSLGSATLSILGGFVLLVLGGELLVRGAAAIATIARISPLVIGLTVVAYGTSAPELAVSLIASLEGQNDVAVGNVVGSNIFNVLVILGISSLIVPLVVSRQLTRFDVPLMIGASFLLLGLGWDGRLDRWDGGLLFSLVVVYTVWSIWKSRRDNLAASPTGELPRNMPYLGILGVPMRVAQILLGLGLLAGGSHWLVDGAVLVAKSLGVSELVIGLTIVAAGTSLPEVATSIVAAIRGQRDIAVGNVVGSNLFNILCVLGAASLVARAPIDVAPAARTVDIPIMIAVALACFPVFFTGQQIARWEGGMFLAFYLAYLVYLVLDATHHDWSPKYQWIMAGFVVPITGVALVGLAVRSFRARLPEGGTR